MSLGTDQALVTDSEEGMAAGVGWGRQGHR